MIIDLKTEIEKMKVQQQKFIAHIETLEECICSLSISDHSSADYKKAVKVANNICHRKRPADRKSVIEKNDDSVTSSRTSKSPPISKNTQIKVNYAYPKSKKVKNNDEKLRTAKDDRNYE